MSRALILLTILLAIKPVLAQEEGVTLRGFADVGVYKSNDDTNSSFYLGALDLFLTKNLDQKTSFLVELLFETRKSDQQPSGELGTDLERIFGSYKVNDWLKVSAGRFHTALGYWNETYHHGTFLYDSISRPIMFRFEDGGGFLPLHTIGVELRGNGEVLGGNFGYVANFGNGRGLQKDPPQTFHDQNKPKSFSFVTYFEMKNGLRFGGTFFSDTIPSGTVKTLEPDSTGTVKEVSTYINGGHEDIYGAHIVYRTPKFEFLSEYLRMNHKYAQPLSTKTTVDALYAQAEMHFKKLTPFYRYELNKISNPDTYTELTVSNYVNTFGARYDFSEFMCAKVEHESMSIGNKTTALSVAWTW